MRILLVYLLWLSMAGAAHAQTHPLNVVASFSILGDMAHEVARDRVNLITLVGPGSDTHSYSATPADAKAIAHADVVIVNGLGFEGWMERILQAANYKGPVIVASNGVIPLYVDNTVDPHAWQNIANGKIYVTNIRDGLMKADPENADFYATNAKEYLHKLTDLDTYVRMQVAQIPASERRAITSHDALHYFAHAYGIVFLAPLGLSTAGDASAGSIAKLIDQMRNEHVHALFLENISDPRIVTQLAREGDAAVGGTIYTDTLSAGSGPASTYIAMFNHNIQVMKNTMIRTP